MFAKFTDMAMSVARGYRHVRGMGLCERSIPALERGATNSLPVSIEFVFLSDRG